MSKVKLKNVNKSKGKRKRPTGFSIRELIEKETVKELYKIAKK